MKDVTIEKGIKGVDVRELIKDISFIQICHEFGGRNHSTVMKACDKVQKKLEKDLNYRQAIDDIKNKLV